MPKVGLKPSPLRHKGRVLALQIMGLLLFCAIGAKLVVLQVIWHDRLESIAERQFYGRSSIQAPRGTISDRDGRLLAVELQRVYRLTAAPDSVFQAGELAQRLSAILERPARGLRHRLQSSDRRVRLADALTMDQAAAVRSLQHNGLFLEETGIRRYPNGSIAGNLLGSVDYRGHGVSGVEAACDSLLRGVPGEEYYLRFASGRPMTTISNEDLQRRDATPGAEIALTIDLRIQTIAEEELANAREKWRAQAAQLIMMDASSGELLALVAQPGYNPDSHTAYDADAARMRCITDQYEPGSTLKAITYAAALEHGAIEDPEELVYCHEGSYRVANRVIHDSNREGYDTLSVAEIFSKSSNIGTVLLAQRMEREELYVMLRSFGFGCPTGIELGGECSGSLPRLSQWGPVEFANIAMGQGVAVNALQVCSAFAAVMNDGVLVRPRLIRSVKSPGFETRSEAVRVRRVVSRDTAHRLLNMMQRVVEDGTAPAAAIDGLCVYGKTGTAQKVDPETRRYSHRDYVSSFVGMTEIHHRPLVCLILLDTPRGAVYGGTVAAPVFRRVCERVMQLEEDTRSADTPYYWVGDPVPQRLVGEDDGLREELSELSTWASEIYLLGQGRTCERVAGSAEQGDIARLRLN